MSARRALLLVLITVCALVPLPTRTLALAASYFSDTVPRSSGPMAIVGDSLTISYWDGLPASFRAQGFGPFQMEARSGRRTTVSITGATSGIEGVRHIRASGFDPPLWVIALGTNDLNITAKTPGATDATINAMLDEIGPGHRVVWINTYSKKSLTNVRAFNARLDAIALQRPMMTVADWYTVALAHPNWFVADGVHPNATGAVQRNNFVAAQALTGRGARQFGPQAAAGTAVGSAARFSPLDGPRLLDSVQANTPLAANAERVVTVPAELRGDASGAVVNLTALGRGTQGYVVAYACGAAVPPTSNVNFAPTGGRAATTPVALDAAGSFCVRSSQPVDLQVDLQGLLSPTTGLAFVPLAPSRLLDTRQPPRSAVLGVGEEIELVLPTTSSVLPTAGLVNVTVVGPAVGAAVAVGPCGQTNPPIASAPAGMNVANAAWVHADANGHFCVRSTATTHVVIDLQGVFIDGPGAALQLAAPARVLDTRSGQGGWIGMPTTFQSLAVQPTGVPAGAVATMYTITSTRSLGGGWVVSWPCSTARPTVSILNLVPGSSVANSTVNAPDMCLATSQGAHLIADLTGWFVPIPL